MTGVATLAVVDPVDDTAWDQLVRQHPFGTVFHSPPWLRALQDTYGFRFRANLALDGEGRPRAGLVHSRIEDPLGSRVLSLPFSDFCDPLVDEPATWQALTRDLLTEADRVQLRCLHNEIPRADERFELLDRAVWHRVDLRGTHEEAWDRLDASARRAIRRARDAGLRVVEARSEGDLRQFFELHLQVRKHKYRLLAQPYRFFLALWDEFVGAGDGTLLLARRDADVVGGVFFLGWGDTLYYKFNASDPQHLGVRPNDLVVWEAMAMARERGYRFLDFGLSAWEQEGLQRFKRKYATEERDIALLRHTATAPGAHVAETRRLLELFTGLAVGDRTPDHVTEAAGNVLYRYFA
ncbi:GNAT family N-acetyltransferase [Egicoccus sp. AB-alg2]|uniref:GNAT family N-acetyltransferase n=1 Tax=Egicoccus sp. AB-alg2 TaxID=3242693 RepID=UPI00359E304C